jgi:hypothetical protein
MNSIGLHCPDTEIQNLIRHKNAVLSSLSQTKNMAYSVLGPKNRFSAMAFQNGTISEGELTEQYIVEANSLGTMADGEWEIDDTGLGYQEELTTIQVPVNFMYLKANLPSFTGQIKVHSTQQQCQTVDAIKNLYIQTAMTASGLFAEKINKHSLEAFFSNAISALEAPTADYRASDSRVMMLALEYDPATKDAKGIGVINISWDIYIQNYTRKDKNGGDYHDTSISVQCYGVFYSSTDVLDRDYLAVKNRVKSSNCLMLPPEKPIELAVYDELPEANTEAFLSGIPSTICEEYIESVILHSASVNKVASVSPDANQNIRLLKGFGLNVNTLTPDGVKYLVKAEASADGIQMQAEYLITEDDACLKESNMAAEASSDPLDVHTMDIQAAVLRYYTESREFEYVTHDQLNTCSVKVIGGGHE